MNESMALVGTGWLGTVISHLGLPNTFRWMHRKRSSQIMVVFRFKKHALGNWLQGSKSIINCLVKTEQLQRRQAGRQAANHDDGACLPADAGDACMHDHAAVDHTRGDAAATRQSLPVPEEKSQRSMSRHILSWILKRRGLS